MSGGSDFVPETRVLAEAEIAPQIQQVETVANTTVAVTRSSATPTLISLSLPTREDVSTPEVAAEVIAPVVEASLTATDTEEPEVAEVITPPLDLRQVAGSRVNMRAGPGTNFDVLDTLDGGTQAEVLLVDASGWAQIRIESTGQIGWMAERLLTDG